MSSLEPPKGTPEGGDQQPQQPQQPPLTPEEAEAGRAFVAANREMLDSDRGWMMMLQDPSFRARLSQIFTYEVQRAIPPMVSTDRQAVLSIFQREVSRISGAASSIIIGAGGPPPLDPKTTAQLSSILEAIMQQLPPPMMAPVRGQAPPGP